MLKSKSEISISRKISFAPETIAKHNLNQLIIGRAGTGKSLFCITPQICACIGNYIVCDPKLELMHRTSPTLQKAGYRIMTIDIAEYSYVFQNEPDFHRFRQEFQEKTKQDISFSDKYAIFITAPVTYNCSSVVLWEAVKMQLGNIKMPSPRLINVILDDMPHNIPLDGFTAHLKKAASNNIRFVVTAHHADEIITTQGSQIWCEMLKNIHIKLYLGVVDLKNNVNDTVCVEVGRTAYCDKRCKYKNL